MYDTIRQWLIEQGLPASYLSISSQLAGVIAIFILLCLSYYIAKHQVLNVIHKLLVASKNTWDDEFIHHKVFSRLAYLVPLILLLILTPLFLREDSLLTIVLNTFAQAAICIQVARSLSAILNVVKSIYFPKARERYLPLNSIIQVIKLALYIITAILVIAIIIGRSPVFLLSGLGALTAVILLIFQDTIKGFVASIQISANRMVAPGDWIALPDYGADGDVIEIGLNTVKIQNFDRTVTTVPTYALISGSFKNWRDMFNSGGRRIKRSIVIDVNSISFLSLDKINELKSISLLNNYLTAKDLEINNVAKSSGVERTDLKNSRQLTNIGTFRAYIEYYLKKHENVHKEMTCMVRQLAAKEAGLPLELYFFSSEVNWLKYEAIQADIFDHLYAIAPMFNLRIFQHPSGYDWSKSNK